MLESKGYEIDYKYDWIIKRNKIEKEISSKSDNKTGTTRAKTREKKDKEEAGNRKRSKKRKDE